MTKINLFRIIKIEIKSFQIVTRNYRWIKNFRFKFEQIYGNDVIARKGNEIIFTIEQLLYR